MVNFLNILSSGQKSKYLKINKLTEVSGFDPRIINQTQGSS